MVFGFNALARIRAMCILTLLVLATFFFPAFTPPVQAAGKHWIETASDADAELTIEPTDPSSSGMKRGREVCRLPAGKRIFLYDAPRTLPLEPDYLHVSLEAPLNSECELLDGWVFRGHIRANSEETNRTSNFKLRTKVGAKIRTSDGTVDRCQLPADTLLHLTASPVWSASVPGGIEVTLLNNVLGCDTTTGVILGRDVNLFESTPPIRIAVGAEPTEDPTHWFTTGNTLLSLRIRADVPEAELELRTGRCVLPPRTRFALKQEPGTFNANTLHVFLAKPVANCDFTFGYIDRKGIRALSSASGVSMSDGGSVRGTEPGLWFQVGAIDTWLAIRTDVPTNELPTKNGRCRLTAGSRYWLEHAPGHSDENHIQVLFHEPLPGCAFVFGYVPRAAVGAHSPLDGVAPYTPSTAALARIAEAAQSLEGGNVFSIGCPQSYRRGTGSVCCARVVSTVLAQAGVSFTPSDAVVVLVANLKKKGWIQIPIAEAPRGAVVFHDKTPGSHGEQHVGICSNAGCSLAWNSWQQRFSNNGYPSMKSFAPTLARGGNWGGALVPP